MYRTHIASRELEAAGAWYTAATASSLPGNWREHGTVAQITVQVTYTRGGAGGYPAIRPVWSSVAAADGSTLKTSRDTTNDGTATVSSGAIQISNYRTEVRMKGFSDLATIDTDDVIFVVPPGKTHVKIECAEVGNTGAPGTIVVDIDGEI